MEKIIRKAIHKVLLERKSKYVIFPFGEQGKLFKRILNNEFGIEEVLVIDNGNHDDDSHVKSFHEVDSKLLKECTVFLVSDNTQIYFELRTQILQFVPEENIVDVFGGDRRSIDMIKSFSVEKTMRVLFNPILNLKKESSVKALGGNTGNLVFVEAIKEQLDYDCEAVFTREWTRERLGKKNITSIMPASNFLRPSAWGEDLMPVIQDTDIRFTFVGLGAQASFHETPKDVVDKLSEKQRKFFRLVSEHAIQIGVRGEFTAECLKELGITNVEIIGCTSF